MMRREATLRLILVVAALAGAVGLAGYVNAAQEENASEMQVVEDLCQKAQANIEAWDFLTARALAAQIEQTALYQSDEAVREKVQRLSEKIATAQYLALKQWNELQTVLEGIRSKIEAWNFDQAGDLLERVQEPGVYRLDDETHKVIATLKESIAATANQADQQRQEAAALLQQAEAKLQGGDLSGAADIVAGIETTDLFQRDENSRKSTEELKGRIGAAEELARQQDEQIKQMLEDLEGISAQIQASNFDEAAEALALAEGKDAFRLDEGVQKKVAQLKDELASARANEAEQRSQVTAMLQEAEQKIASGDLAGADEALNSVARTATYTADAEIRKSVKELRDRLAVESKAAEQQRLAEARDLLKQGLEACEAKDYAAAKALLDKAAGYEVKLGRRLTNALNLVNSELERCAREFEEAKRLYEFGQYEQAKEILTSLQQSGIKCGPEIDKGVGEYLTQIKSKEVEAAAARAAALPQMAEERRKLVEAQAERERIRQQLGSTLAQARRYWDADRFEQAKEGFLAAKALLAKLDPQADPDLRNDQAEVEAKLAVADGRIAMQKLFSEVDELGRTGKWLDAEEKLGQALEYAKQEAIELTPAEQAIRVQVEDGIEKTYGQERRERAARYWELAQQADNCTAAREWGHALQLLEMVQGAEGLHLSPEQQDTVARQIASVREQLGEHDQALERVRTLMKNAEGAANADPAGALGLYQQAFQVAAEAGVAEEAILPELEVYATVASTAFRTLVSSAIAKLKAETEDSLKGIAEACDYALASFYSEAGSPHLAKPLLEKVTGSKNADERTAALAKQALEGIDEQIESMHRAEVLAAKETVDKIFEMEQRFQQLMQAGDNAAAAELSRQIDVERANWHALMVKNALDRGDYPAAKELIGGNEEDPASKDVAAWERGQGLIAQAQGALMNLDAATVSEALAGLQEIKLPGDPFARAIEVLTQAREAVLHLVAEESELNRNATDSLDRVRNSLALARMQQAAWDQYSEALGFYAEGKWMAAAGRLEELTNPAVPLHPFERAQADAMLEACKGRLSAPQAVAQGGDVEQMLHSASEEISARDFISAADLLNEIEATEAYRLDSKLRAGVDALREKVAAAEKEAEGLCKGASDALERNDKAGAARLLGQLRSRYRRTRFFVEHWSK